MTIRFVDVEGSHFEMGCQHGKLLRDVIRDNVRKFALNLLEISRTPTQTVQDFRSRYEEIIRREFGYVLDEAAGIANGSGLEYEDILFNQLIWEFLDCHVPFEKRQAFLHISSDVTETSVACSSFVAAGDATIDGLPIASQNSDWPELPILREVPVAIRASPKARFKFIGRGLAGFLGTPRVIGFNEMGLAFVGSGVHQKSGAEYGVPPLLVAREGLENFGSVDEVVNLVRRIRTWGHGGENLDVVDAKGNMARIGFASPQAVIVTTTGHFLASTNHYHHDEMKYCCHTRESYPSSYFRYERLVQLLQANYGKLDPQLSMRIMSDHEFGSSTREALNSICRHGDASTINNITCRPKRGELWISDGNPCQGDYSRFSLNYGISKMTES